MKKYINLTVMLIALLAMGTTFNACGGDESKNDDDNIEDNKTYLLLSMDSISFSENETVKEVKITSNASWKITDIPEWMTVSPSFGLGETTVSISLQKISVGEERSAIIHVVSDNLNKVIKVFQRGRKKLNVSCTSFVFGNNASSETVLLKVAEIWDLKIPSYMEWCHVDKSSGTGDAELLLKVDENPFTIERGGAITVYDKKYGDNVKIDVLQKGKNFLLDNKPSESIDLGLSVKWASCNIGAERPEEAGAYYAWGETTQKSSYLSENYIYGDGSKSSNTYQNIGQDISGTNYDVATTNWGTPWRMPTKMECEELIANCDKEWIIQNGIWGVKFTGKNGNSIFLPASGGSSEYRGVSQFQEQGRYWTATLDIEMDSRAYSLAISQNWTKESPAGFVAGGRYYGNTVRPVCP